MRLLVALFVLAYNSYGAAIIFLLTPSLLVLGDAGQCTLLVVD